MKFYRHAIVRDHGPDAYFDTSEDASKIHHGHIWEKKWNPNKRIVELAVWGKWKGIESSFHIEMTVDDLRMLLDLALSGLENEGSGREDG